MSELANLYTSEREGSLESSQRDYIDPLEVSSIASPMLCIAAVLTVYPIVLCSKMGGRISPQTWCKDIVPGF